MCTTILKIDEILYFVPFINIAFLLIRIFFWILSSQIFKILNLCIPEEKMLAKGCFFAPCGQSYSLRLPLRSPPFGEKPWVHVFGRWWKQALFTGFSLDPVKSEKEKEHISDFPLCRDFSTLSTWTWCLLKMSTLHSCWQGCQ